MSFKPLLILDSHFLLIFLLKYTNIWLIEFLGLHFIAKYVDQLVYYYSGLSPPLPTHLTRPITAGALWEISLQSSAWLIKGGQFPAPSCCQQDSSWCLSGSLTSGADLWASNVHSILSRPLKQKSILTHENGKSRNWGLQSVSVNWDSGNCLPSIASQRGVTPLGIKHCARPWLLAYIRVKLFGILRVWYILKMFISLNIFSKEKEV